MHPHRLPEDIARKLVDPSVYAADELHQVYAWLRQNQPLGVAEVDGFDPFWVVARHADILEVSRQNSLFHSGDMATVLTKRSAVDRVRAMTGGSPHLVRSLVQMDAPDHLKYRALTQGWFMPPNLRKLEAEIRLIARRAVEKLVATEGECDFVADVALGYPLHVIMSILGVPEVDERRMLALTQELFSPQDSDTARTPPPGHAGNEAAMIDAVLADFSAYFGAITADRRANPRDDLATVIANAVVDGEPISDLEATSYYIIVATAGHDTTSSSIAGGVWALAQNPELFAMAKADPNLIPGLVDEAIRWTTPVKTFMRSATEDVELGGRTIHKGDWLMLCYASGNRDEAVFEEPNTFRPERKPNRHLSFGYGAHLCLGQHLAKMEMRILFEELLPRVESLDLAGPPEMTKSWFVNGPKKLPIRLKLSERPEVGA
jgi:cytochrome P450